MYTTCSSAVVQPQNGLFTHGTMTVNATPELEEVIDLIGDLVREETSAGRLNASVPLEDLPYVLVRIMESYIYIGLITGEDPDPDRAAAVINALLPAAAGRHDT